MTREYEHLVMAMTMADGRPATSYMQIPHPSGLTVDREQGVVHIASTRNPNEIFDLAPAAPNSERLDVSSGSLPERPLVPIRSRFFPGCLYIHDLATIGNQLYANAVGQNAVVRLDHDGNHPPVWWPRLIETQDGPLFDRNAIQLNSIAAGPSLETSYFSASTDKITARRPGHANFVVDRRGVIFSGATREPVARGLTRPHSTRLLDGQVWVDNSGYGEVGVAEGGSFTPVARLPGWTRGLCFHGAIAFVGTSRVIPRFRQYAPGLNVDASRCGIHAIDTRNGKVLGSLYWPYGNQIFAIDWVSKCFTSGFPIRYGVRTASSSTKELFYAYTLTSGEKP